MRTLALFDLDGTLTRADTMLDFLRFTHGRSRLFTVLAGILPLWCLSKLHLSAADAPKRALVRRYFNGGKAAWEAAAERYARERMPGLLWPGALACIQAHQAAGIEVVVVTASCSLWAGPWCRSQGLVCIATELEEKDGSYTGRLATANCKGEEKVRRVRSFLGNGPATIRHAYGDTPSDRPMLSMAQEVHYRPFR